MKLNPGKCTLWVEEGQSLGYQKTNEGISPNQAKIQEFLDSKTLHKLKGVQEINGRLTKLGRFIAKSAEKNQFKWTPEAEKALQHLKEALHHLPAMASPLLGETL